MSAKQENTECAICADNFTLHRKCVKCPSCDFECCSKCLRTYILSQRTDPSCMSCKAALDREFLIGATNKSFMNVTYKNHRRELLFEHEKSRFPETMGDVTYVQELRDQIATLSDENINIQDEVKKIKSEAKSATQDKRKELNSIQDEIRKLQEKSEAVRDTINEISKPFNDKAKQLTTKKDQNENIIRRSRWTITSYQNGEFTNFVQNGKTKTKTNFVNPCCNGECNGFLDENWKCNSCMNYSCNKCLEVIGTKKGQKHVCNPDSVETAKLLKKETKPCPKCGTRIYKINGCDQMWCTCCHVAFSWNTGNIERGIIHNPHYYNFRRNGGAAVVRAPGDFVCGGMPDYGDIYDNANRVNSYFNRRKILNIPNTETPIRNILNSLLNFHNGLNHNQESTMRRLRENVNEDVDNRDLRYNLLSNKINTDEFKKKLSRRDGTRFKNQTVLHVFELLGAVCTENYRDANNSMQNLMNAVEQRGPRDPDNEEFSKFASDTLIAIHENWKNIVKIIDYCNEQFERQSKTIGMSTYQISRGCQRGGRAVRHKW